jgi:uncharacterized protein involved in exopolysaccharide biosynthesis
MSLRERPRVEPDLDAEAEVDLGRYWTSIAARWWLPLAGLVVGALVGYLAALGGHQVYRAQALVYLGQPFTPSGSAQLQSIATNPSTVREIARSTATIRKVAADTGLPEGKLRAGVSTQAVAGNLARLGQTPLVAVSVKGDAPRKIAQAANEIARIVVARISPYVDTKIETLRAELASADQELASLDARLDAANRAAENPSLSPVEKLVALNSAGLLEQRRATVLGDRLDARQLLALAERVEKPRVADLAAPRKTTARSRRNSIVVGALIGLILGLAAALAWERAASRLSRRPAL